MPASIFVHRPGASTTRFQRENRPVMRMKKTTRPSEKAPLPLGNAFLLN
jgi:hypothetical protein